MLAVLIAAQLALPGIAADRVRDRLRASGEVLSVQVHAFPAIELLWHHADRVLIRMRSYRSAAGSLRSLLGDTSGVGSLDASATVLHSGLLTLRDATVRKRGERLTGTARVTEADLRTAIPILSSVTPVPSADGRLTLRGTASVFGVTASVDANVRAQDGRLVVVPQVPFGALATVTVFDDPRVEVDAVSASSAPGGFRVAAAGRLR